MEKRKTRGWGRAKKNKERKEQEGLGQILLVHVNSRLERYHLDMLHNGHMGLQGMLHKKRMWNIPSRKQHLLERLRSCKVCRRHCTVNRDTQLRTLNTSTKPSEEIEMDYIEPLDGKYLLVTVDFLSRRVQMDMHKITKGACVIRSLQRCV